MKLAWQRRVPDAAARPIEVTLTLALVALLCDRLFKKVGLNGRAVITMVLGLGCATMATVTTRTLENRRDRVIATLLLVLTIPCSARLPKAATSSAPPWCGT